MTQHEIKEIIKSYKNQILDFKKLQNNFENELTNITNKKDFILNEIESVKQKAVPTSPSAGRLKNTFSTNNIAQQSFYCDSYVSYLYTLTEPDFRRKEYTEHQIIRELNGVTWAKYQMYLSSLLVKTKEPKKTTYTHIKQVAILYFLGLTDKIDNTQKIAELVAPLIDRDAETTRQKLCELPHDIKDRQMLNEIKDLFLKLGLTDKVQLVEKELNKLR
ncbi:MAG: hypothetical protein VB102_11820 [Paludibacter sp.]|nr:hypothetical protein [Paludibacter sp.]